MTPHRSAVRAVPPDEKTGRASGRLELFVSSAGLPGAVYATAIPRLMAPNLGNPNATAKESSATTPTPTASYAATTADTATTTASLRLRRGDTGGHRGDRANRDGADAVNHQQRTRRQRAGYKLAEHSARIFLCHLVAPCYVSVEHASLQKQT
jgi:hypothetical protein